MRFYISSFSFDCKTHFLKKCSPVVFGRFIGFFSEFYSVFRSFIQFLGFLGIGFLGLLDYLAIVFLFV